MMIIKKGNAAILIFIIITFFGLNNAICRENLLGQIVYMVKMDSVGIYCNEDGEGPTGFSVLNEDKFGLWNGKTLMIINAKEAKIERIEMGINAEHYDINFEGDGFCTSIDGKLLRIKNFKVNTNPLQVKFPLTGITGGRFRIDLITTDSIRIIGRSPDFIIQCYIDSITKVTIGNKSVLEQGINRKASSFVGTFNNKYIFFQIDVSKAPNNWQILAWDPSGNEISKEIKIEGKYIGQPFLFSYPFRIDGEGNIYVMLRHERNLLIRKFDYKELFQ